MRLTAEFDADAVNKTSTAHKITRHTVQLRTVDGSTEHLRPQYPSSPAVWPDHETIAGSFISFG